MTYILAITAKRKGAKRHIVFRGDLDTLRRYAGNMWDRYIVEIYTSNRKLVERVKG